MSCPCCCGDDRRGFLAKTLAVACAATACAVPAMAGLVAFLNPWRQKSQAGNPVRITSLSALTLDGPPQQFPVIADRTDAWSRLAAEPVGAVLLQRTGEDKVLAFQAECPHAGCFIVYDAKAKDFACPCHAARFDLEGKRSEEKSMSPRDLDTLDVEIRSGGEVWVNFTRFQTGTPDKKLLA